jgi:DNA-binding PadR family transcriptional regulator
MSKHDAEAKLLNFLVAEPDGKQHYVYDLMKATGLKSGDVYVALAHWEVRGIVFSDWAAPEKHGQPRRRYYVLSSYGRLYAEAQNA